MMGGDPQAEARIGSVLHEKWTLERLLGVGGMGAVYAARHRNGARAAVKVLSPAMGRVPHIRKRFLHEGYAANRVEHGGAVKVLDDDVIADGTDEGTAYLVMELLDGESLGDRAKRDPPLGERDLLAIADGLLAVLDAAHIHGVVHRDLKPDNLFLARDPEREGTQIKVLDFGLARLLEAHETTIAGMALGTPTYMSPEQAAGKVDQIDGRTDIYALGSILFQLASHRRIHDAAHTLGLVVRMATTPAPKLKTVAPDVSDAFAGIVDRALAFDRGDRYPNASAMRADVQAALALLPAEDGTLVVLPASPGKSDIDSDERRLRERADTVQAVRAVTVAAAPEPSRAERPSPPPRRERADTGGSPLRTVFLLLLLGGGGFFLWANREALAARFAGSDLMPSTSSSTTPAELVDAAPAEPVDAEATTLSVDAAPVMVVPLDAALDEPADASADGGEDEEDDDEDEELEAGADASVRSANEGVRPGPRRTAPHNGSAAKPTKKKTPRRPGQPRRKKRWHW
jgi:serine/threonine protein kinase